MYNIKNERTSKRRELTGQISIIYVNKNVCHTALSVSIYIPSAEEMVPK